MNDQSTIGDIQAFAVVEEYRKALSTGAQALATKIRNANPDLAQRFAVVDKVLG